MASVGYQEEVGSFAIDARNKEDRYYYIGTLNEDTGGDGEILLNNVKQISYKEYLSLRKQYVSTSNKIINSLANRRISVIDKGYNVGVTTEQVEQKRKRELRPE